MPDATRFDQKEIVGLSHQRNTPDRLNQTENLNISADIDYEWLKSKFPILIVIFLFASFSLILGFIAPKFASCCGTGCPLINQNDILTASLNDRIDIIGSIQLKLLCLISMVALVPATIFYGKHKVLLWTLFDHTLIFVLCIWMFRTMLLLNILSGFHFGGCV